MKHRLFLLAALLICVLPLSSFRDENRRSESNFIKRPTDVEYGEFAYGSHVYAVYGDSSGSTITGIYNFDLGYVGAPVWSWAGIGFKGIGVKPGYANVTVHTDATH